MYITLSLTCVLLAFVSFASSLSHTLSEHAIPMSSAALSLLRAASGRQAKAEQTRDKLSEMGHAYLE